MSKKIFRKDFYGRNLIVEVNELAKQSSGSALIKYDDTIVLSNANASKKAKDIDFFPLTVTYEEKLYAAGKIPGGFLRREGRPSEHATLTSRLIDRPIRPLFAEGFRNEVQVVNTVLSIDIDKTSEMTAMFGSSLALCISDIPFNGPIAGVNVGYINGEFIINPTIAQMEVSLLDLQVAGTKKAINMVEAGAKEVSEEVMLEALLFGHKHIIELCEFQDEIVKEVGKIKREVELYSINSDIIANVDALAKSRFKEAIAIKLKQERYSTIDNIEEEVLDYYDNMHYDDIKVKESTMKQVKDYCHQIVADEVRRLISIEKIRPDGRAIDEIRSLDSQIDILPRVHGSALFTRGETQVLSITTLGSIGDSQIIDDITNITGKHFMHHYNFPPYSVGEVGRMGSPGRREIGHGALGERALLQVLPDKDEFPYAIRLVSEVLESNGSSSQASICAGSMSLMAAGVPIKGVVSGVAMGLVTYDDHYTILSDIQGMEDHFGDMDFKVAGTSNGITALQMDIKIEGINRQILQEALQQAKIARKTILDNMLGCIDRPRDYVSEYAPKMLKLTIPVDKIREVIGPGGKMINSIIEECNQVKIDIDDDGKCVIYHHDNDSLNKAYAMIELILKEAKLNEEFHAKVIKIEKFGAFVELFSGKDALLHISKISNDRIDKVEDVLKIGDHIDVIVNEIDEKGRISVIAKGVNIKKDNNRNNNNGEKRSFKKHRQ